MTRRVVDQNQHRLFDPLRVDFEKPLAPDLVGEAGGPLPGQHTGGLDQPRDEPARGDVLPLQRRRTRVGPGQEMLECQLEGVKA